MSDVKIKVINYLDGHAIVENKKIIPFSLQQLKEVFPNVDEFTLHLWQKEWIDAREVMLNIEF